MTAALDGPGVGQHRVAVTLARRDRATFLSLVSMLHRRGVEVFEAELRTAPDAYFTATFLATSAQATTVVASLRNLIDVMDAELTGAPRLVVAG
jgi:glucose-6-phosphate dehydrogenase assembly protein OpcA